MNRPLSSNVLFGSDFCCYHSE